VEQIVVTGLRWQVYHYGLISNKETELFIGLYKDLIRKLRARISKPLAVVLHSYANEDTRKLAHEMKRQLINDGFAVFLSMQRAAVALGQYAGYYGKRKSHLLDNMFAC